MPCGSRRRIAEGRDRPGRRRGRVASSDASTSSINNAGVDAAAPAIDYTEADWDFVLDVNLKAYFFFAQAAAKVMIANGGGAIASNSSICGDVAVKNISAYNISKGGVNMMTKSLALEWAPHGIRVNAFSPAYMEVFMPGAAGEHDEAKEQAVRDLTPLARRGRPEELVGPGGVPGVGRLVVRHRRGVDGRRRLDDSMRWPMMEKTEIFDYMAANGHEKVLCFQNEDVGLRAMLAIHSTVLGPAAGGCRMWTYTDDLAAMEDALRLSKGMTYKYAAAGINLGGGKIVVIGDPKRTRTVARCCSGRSVGSSTRSAASTSPARMSAPRWQTWIRCASRRAT